MKAFAPLVLGLAASGAFASDSNLELDLRYLNQRTQTDTFAQTLLYRQSVYSWMELQAGARFWEARSFLDGVSYMGQARLAPVPWAGVVLRLEQIDRLSDSTTGTVLLGTIDLRGEFFHGFGGYAAFGYYKVFHSLSQSIPVPTFSSISFTDEDLATEFGLWGTPVRDWLVKVGVGTYEEVDVYNLNNPFVELRVETVLGSGEWSAGAFGRYQLLLGFGRSDNLTFGVGLRHAL